MGTDAYALRERFYTWIIAGISSSVWVYACCTVKRLMAAVVSSSGRKGVCDKCLE